MPAQRDRKTVTARTVLPDRPRFVEGSVALNDIADRPVAIELHVFLLKGCGYRGRSVGRLEVAASQITHGPAARFVTRTTEAMVAKTPAPEQLG
jgi:hypothetical protein